jgi:hypothetical protein
MLRREALPNGRDFLLCVVAYGPALIAAVLLDADARWLTGTQFSSIRRALRTRWP